MSRLACDSALERAACAVAPRNGRFLDANPAHPRAAKRVSSFSVSRPQFCFSGRRGWRVGVRRAIRSIVFHREYSCNLPAPIVLRKLAAPLGLWSCWRRAGTRCRRMAAAAISIVRRVLLLVLVCTRNVNSTHGAMFSPNVPARLAEQVSQLRPVAAELGLGATPLPLQRAGAGTALKAPAARVPLSRDEADASRGDAAAR